MILIMVHTYNTFFYHGDVFIPLNITLLSNYYQQLKIQQENVNDPYYNM